jgi:regulator of protease activity HflC (stomatin/prohibitin superfamily)
VQTNALSSAEATRRLHNAEADQCRAELGAGARVALYTNQIAAYRAAPEVYAQRAYLQTLLEGSRGARKYILATTNTDDVIQFNFEDKIREDLLNIGLPPPKEK